MMYKEQHSRKRPVLLLWIGLAVIGAILYYIADSIKLNAGEDAPEINARAAILIDAGTGEVLFEKNAQEALPPASMSKMMTQLLVLDQIEEGTLAWNDPVAASAYAAQVPGSQIGFDEGDVYTVREMFDAMVVHSANDAAVALAEHIGGTETAFVELMNQRARKLGLSEETLFANATGLNRQDLIAFAAASNERDTLMPAKDVAQLAGYLIKRYPVILEVASRGSVKLSSHPQLLKSTNEMLAGRTYEYPGNDGLKTGYTPEAGYCFTGTAKQNDKRLISVVMGASTPELRFAETKKLYQFGFKREGLGSLLAQFQS